VGYGEDFDFNQSKFSGLHVEHLLSKVLLACPSMSKNIK
jgi:hypothetical protein